MGMVNESKSVPRDAITESETLVERILEQRPIMSRPKYGTIGMYVSSLIGIGNWQVERTLGVASCIMDETVGKEESGWNECINIAVSCSCLKESDDPS